MKLIVIQESNYIMCFEHWITVNYYRYKQPSDKVLNIFHALEKHDPIDFIMKKCSNNELKKEEIEELKKIFKKVEESFDYYIKKYLECSFLKYLELQQIRSFRSFFRGGLKKGETEEEMKERAKEQYSACQLILNGYMYLDKNGEFLPEFQCIEYLHNNYLEYKKGADCLKAKIEQSAERPQIEQPANDSDLSNLRKV